MHLENYGIYSDLVTNGIIDIYTKDINKSNIDQHFEWIINILKDGIEEDNIIHLKVHVIFTDNIDLNLFIIDYMFNLMYWSMIVSINKVISSKYWFPSNMIPHTVNNYKAWIDDRMVRPNTGKFDNIKLNRSIDNTVFKYTNLEPLQMYMANTVNIEDTIALMNKYKEFYDSVHFDASNIPLEDLKEEGQKAANVQIRYIKNSNHCLRDSFIAGEGINPKQYKEVSTNIGPKPTGHGDVYPHPIQGSYMNGGLRNVEEIVMDSAIGRVAQILQKQNVGQSGAFARNLGLNNCDSKLHLDPNYICDTKNFIKLTIENSDMLDELDMRYYRKNPNGIEYKIDKRKDKQLIGETIYLRSPMTCASAARGEGICYRCYGDLAYINRDINIGQIAAELLSAIYTQMLLSAKHLLESAIVKMTWTDIFYDLFDVDYNQISLKEDFNYRGYKLCIDEIFEDEEDDDEETTGIVTNSNEVAIYILSFDVIDPKGNRHTIKVSDAENDFDNIYVHEDFMKFLDDQAINDSGTYEIDMTKLIKFPALFTVDVKNNELSKTMKSIKNIIDNKKITKSYTIDAILSDFIKTNLAGNIKINSVHFEVLLMNQIRAYDDILELPDWTKSNEVCQILTLNESLTNNRSISVRLQASKIARALTHPSNRLLHRPSNMDPYYMERPQEFLTEEYQASTYKLKEVEKKVVSPIYFIDDGKVTGGSTDFYNTDNNEEDESIDSSLIIKE